MPSNRLPIKISQELIYIALVESFYKSLATTDMGSPGSPGKRFQRTTSSPRSPPRSPPKGLVVDPLNMITPERTPEYIPPMNVHVPLSEGR